MKDRELIKKAMAFAIKNITDKTLTDASLKIIVDDFENQEVSIETIEYDGRVYESDLYCFEVTRLKNDDDIYIEFTDKRKKPWKEEYWDNNCWMIGILEDNPESLKEIDLCEQGMKELKYLFQDLVNIGWLKYKL